MIHFIVDNYLIISSIFSILFIVSWTRFCHNVKQPNGYPVGLNNYAGGCLVMIVVGLLWPLSVSLFIVGVVLVVIHNKFVK